MKYVFTIACVLLSLNAVAMDPCYESLSQKLMSESEGASWGFLALQPVTKQDAEVMLASALEDMSSEQTIHSAKELIEQEDLLFYNMLWSAPSNEGNSLFIVDERSCQVLMDVGIWSQE